MHSEIKRPMKRKVKEDKEKAYLREKIAMLELLLEQKERKKKK
jgi:hypothetical protein